MRSLEFNLDGKTSTNKPIIGKDELARLVPRTETELLRYHQEFDHLSFPRLNGTMPTCLKGCSAPFCSACAHARGEIRGWRGKMQA